MDNKRKDGAPHCDFCEYEHENCVKSDINKGNPRDIRTECLDF